MKYGIRNKDRSKRMYCKCFSLFLYRELRHLLKKFHCVSKTPQMEPWCAVTNLGQGNIDGSYFKAFRRCCLVTKNGVSTIPKFFRVPKFSQMEVGSSEITLEKSPQISEISAKYKTLIFVAVNFRRNFTAPIFFSREFGQSQKNLGWRKH